MEPTQKKPKVMGPCLWWARNDLRIQDNPVLRLVTGAAHNDSRPFAGIFIFDPRFLDKSPYGRVTDPNFEKSIYTRKEVNFSSRKTNALRARFWRQCVLKLAEEMESVGSKLYVCYGKPEDVLSSLPVLSEVKCQSEPVSIEQTDVEDFAEAALRKNGSKLRKDPGAISLYHIDELPFGVKERPESYSEMAYAFGWKDIWTSVDQEEWATPVRPVTPAPVNWPPPPTNLEIAGLIPLEVLLDETKCLLHLGYSMEEIIPAQKQELPQGGERAARAALEKWAEYQSHEKTDTSSKAVYWDLPCAGQRGASDGPDPFQWRNLTQSTGWLRMSQYLAVGCISPRMIFHRAASTPNFAGAAHRLLWRDFHRLYTQKYGRRVAWLQGPAKVERSWNQDPEIAEAWKQGKTGVPYIDACQRELNTTGWLAYKGRKTAAFFLVHSLGMDWRIGAFHDEETLLDYDFAMNYGNWAVVAKIGAFHDEETLLDYDFAMNYGNWAVVAKIGNGGGSAWAGSRDVDPEHWDLKWKLRAEQENDPTGSYIRRWVPELKDVPDKHIHTPWFMTQTDMDICGCVLGRDYPTSVVGPLDIAGCLPDADAETWGDDVDMNVDELKEQLKAKDKEIAELRQGSACVDMSF